jgi:hypothetical protein
VVERGIYLAGLQRMPVFANLLAEIAVFLVRK